MSYADTFIVSAPGRAKMSIQAAIGYGNWADEFESNHKRIVARGKGSYRRATRKKVKTLRTHRTGK
jgi:hypothetical protein